MNAVDAIAEGARQTGYRKEAFVRNYSFADVLAPSSATRTVSLAAIGQWHLPLSQNDPKTRKSG